MPVEEIETVGVDRWDDCRATWVDVDNGRETRSSELVAAWREQGIDLVRTRAAIELPADVVEDLGLDAELFVFSIRPEYLADDGGLLSYFDLVCRAAEYELRRRQRDRVLDGPSGSPLGDQTGLGEWSE